MFSLLPDVVVQFLDGHGKPLAGGLIYTYESGTTTLKPTFADPEGKTPNTNPVVLDAAGLAKIYLDTGAYRVRILSRDNVLITDTNQVSRFVNNTELEDILKTVNDGLDDLANVEEALTGLIDEKFRTEKGLPNGIAPLDVDGLIPSEHLSIPTASTTEKGLVQIGSGLNVSDGLLSAPNPWLDVSYQNVTASRALNEIYKNETDRIKYILVKSTRRSDSAQEFTAEINSVSLGVIAFAHSSYPSQLIALLPIPPRATYKIGGWAVALGEWWEL